MTSLQENLLNFELIRSACNNLLNYVNGIKKDKQNTQIGGSYLIIAKDINAAYVGISSSLNRRFTRHKIELRNNQHPNKNLQDFYNNNRNNSLDHDSIVESKLQFIPVFEFQYDDSFTLIQKEKITDLLRHIEREILLYMIHNTDYQIHNEKLTEGSKEQRLEIVFNRYALLKENKFEKLDVNKANIFRNLEQYTKEEIKIRKNLLTEMLSEQEKEKNGEIIKDPVDLTDYPLKITSRINYVVNKSTPIVSIKTQQYFPNVMHASIDLKIDNTRLQTLLNRFNTKENKIYRRASKEEIKLGKYLPEMNNKLDAIPQAKGVNINSVAVIAKKNYYNSYESAAQALGISRTTVWRNVDKAGTGIRRATDKEIALKTYNPEFDNPEMDSVVRLGGAEASKIGVIANKKWYDSYTAAANVMGISRASVSRKVGKPNSGVRKSSEEENRLKTYLPKYD